MSLGNRIKNIRESLGKTQKEMSALMDVGLRTWQQYEEDFNSPNWKVVTRLSKLGFSADWLASGEGEMKRGAERGSMEYILDAERRAEVDQGIKQFGCYPLDQGLLKRSIEGAVEWFKAEGIEPTPQQLSEVVIQRYSLIATIKFGALQQGGE